MTGRLLPQPDDLYCFLAYAFAASGKARSHIVGTTDSLDQDACATLERLVPTLGCARPGHCVDLLFGVLWEVSDGDWQRAQGMLAEVGRPRREDVLRQLASSMARVVAMAPLEGLISSQARADLVRRRRQLPRRGHLRPAAPKTMQRDANGVDRSQPAKALVFVPRAMDEILAELAVLPGLGAVRAQIDALLARLQVQEARRRAGLPVADRPMLHAALVGPPGTGKTMVARLLAELYAAMGLLKKPVFVEAGRDSLVALYTGQSAPRTADTVARAQGGVLFLDEAYSLAGDTFAEESLAELMRQMENQRDDLVVIFAGYPAEMEAFIGQNPGLASRIGIVMEFEPYSDRELWQIVQLIATEAGFLLPDVVERLVTPVLAAQRELPGFGNARAARALVDEMITNHALRLVSRNEMNGDALLLLTELDVPRGAPRRSETQSQTGYL